MQRLGVLLCCLSIACASAEQAPVRVAGGALDAALTTAEVYVGTPEVAKVPEGKACLAASRYIERINAGQFAAVADLFAVDGVVLDPERHVLRGREQIRAFYSSYVAGQRPQLVRVAYVGDERDCVVEIASGRTIAGVMRYALVSVDHFTLQGDSVVHMVAFARPSLLLRNVDKQ